MKLHWRYFLEWSNISSPAWAYFLCLYKIALLKKIILRSEMVTQGNTVFTWIKCVNFHHGYERANRKKPYWNTWPLCPASSYSMKYKKIVCVCVCVCVCARACVHACVRAHIRAHVYLKQQTCIRLLGIAASGHICSRDIFCGSS